MTHRERKETIEKVKTPKEVFQTVWRTPPDYQSYQHYTSLDTVLKIIISRQVILSRGDSAKLNDLREGKKFGGKSRYYERETRHCALLSKEIGDKPLFAVVPKGLIGAMRFTFSPWADDAMAKVIETSINAALSAIGIPAARPKFQRFRRSVLQGALNFK